MKYPSIKENILLIAATHGNEGFSLPVIQKLAAEFEVTYIVGNPRALKQNVRGTDGDLNRSGPGNRQSKIYEQRRAATIIKKASRYNVTIDVHGTVSNSGIFLILSDPNWENIELVKTLDVVNVVMWPGLMPTGPMSQFIPRCFEIECVPKDSPQIALELKRILRRYLAGKPRLVKQKFYIVTGQTKGSFDPSLRDFVKTSKYGYPFYPILCGNQYPGITCYQMQRLNDTL
ncbi:MAG: succinylglutamate desuccinylase/aspartoacylase family protein [bacterium]